MVPARDNITNGTQNITYLMIQNIKQWNLYLRAMAVTVLACFAFWVLAQNPAKTVEESNADALLEQLKALSNSDQYEQKLIFADSIANIFASNNWRDKWYQAIRLKTIAQKVNEDAEKAVTQLLPIVQAQTLDDSITAKLFGLLGFACLNARQIEHGAEYYEKCLLGLLRHHCVLGIGSTYMNLGFALKEQGDYRAARQYYLSGLPELTKEGDAWNISEALINLGDISRYISEIDAARNYYNQANQVYPDKGRLAHNLGWADANTGLYQSALKHFQESCQYGDCAEELARIMGHCAEMLGDTTEANRQFHLAMEAAGSAYDTARVQSYIGKALLRRKQPGAALGVFQQALHGLFPELDAHKPSENPSIVLAGDFWPVDILRGKAQAFRALHAHSGKVEDLNQGMAAITVAMAALDSLRGNMHNETSGQDAVDYAYATYETGIQIARSLEVAEPGKGYLAAAYDMAERAKANVLKTILSEKDLRRGANIPDSLLWQEKMAKAAVASWEGTAKADSLLLAVRQLEKVRAAIDKQTPLLRKARAQTQSLPLAAIQQGLADDELLLQYFWGDSAVIVFAVGKNSLDVHSIPRTPALEQSIDAFQSVLTQWKLPSEDFSSHALVIYRQFCFPLLRNTPGINRLLIVPDGRLSTFPFEAVLMNNGRFLVEQYSISYHWSGALWLQSHTRGDAENLARGYGGFAPQYKAIAEPMASLGAKLSDLPEARVAVAAAAKAWGGDVFQGPAVDKQLFQREAGKFGILHLAMHGLLNIKEPTQTGLAFPAGDSIALLNILEISQMELPAQLAVLSACNTASGVVFRGEGVMSLSRAFALAGCPALTANLWEVPSQETNAITANFLQHLKSGESKDDALRAAKLEYLNHAESERKHPFFWAGQVLIGNERPIRQSKNWVWYLLGAGVLGGLGWLGWRYGRRRMEYA